VDKGIACKSVGGEGGQSEEEIADAIIKVCGGTRIGLYSERQLARKIRDESAYIPQLADATCPAVVKEYISKRLVYRVLWESGLTGLERRVCVLLLDGFSREAAARHLGITGQRVGHLLLRIRALIEARPRYDPYFGLHEVYWAEVNRHIYRKPRLEWE